MADTKVKLIVGAIVASLNAAKVADGTIDKPAGLKVSTSRKRPTELADLPHQSVFPLRDDPDGEPGRTMGMVKRVLNVAVMNRCAGEDLDAETLRAWAIQQVMADVSLGGLVLGITEAHTQWAPEADSITDFAEPGMVFEVSYARRRNSLES